VEVTGLDDDDDIGGSGYSLEELSAYLDRGRVPRIAAIESNAQCQAVLASMERMSALSRELVAEEAKTPIPEAWYEGIMREVLREVRAGRDIPLRRPVGGTELVVTEGALRELIRAVGDAVPGVFVGRVRLEQQHPHGPLQVGLSLSVRFGRRIADAVAEVRDAVTAAVQRHGDLRIDEVDVTVDDVHVEEDA
jgi:hypothetical protein